MTFKNYLSLILLSICAFITVSTEFAPLGIMSVMAEALNANQTQIGLSVTIYAWVGTVIALITPLLFGRINRKIFLGVLLLLIALSNYITANAESINSLYLARFIGGSANGAFLSLLAITATVIVKQDVKAKATAIAFLGVSFASAFCIPLVNILSNYLAWREIYAVLSTVAIGCGIGLLLLIPNTRQKKSTTGQNPFTATLKNTKVVFLLLITISCITAHFSIYSFIQPWLSNTLALKESEVSILLLCFGVAGFLGNLLLTKYIDNYLIEIIFGCLLAIGVVLLLFSLYSISTLTMLLYFLFFIWGACASCLIVCLQALVIDLAEQQVESAVAIYVSSFNASIGLGALLGGVLISAFGIYIVMIICAVIIITASVLYKREFLKPKRRLTSN